MRVSITPLDTLFIRDGRAFGINDAHAADSLFPPPPRVVFGAWRGAILAMGGLKKANWGYGKEAIESWPKWFGTPNSPGSLRQEGPVLCLNKELIFPFPQDAVFDRSKEELQPFDLRAAKGLSGSFSTPYCLYRKERLPKLQEPVWISQKALSGYLAQKESYKLEKGKDWWLASDLWSSEERTNVSINPKTGAHIEGHLFSLNHVRPARGVTLFCHWHEEHGQDPCMGTQLVQNGSIRLLNLGGEKKAAQVERITDTDPDWPGLPAAFDNPSENKERFFRLYVATPLYCEGGWFFEENNGECEIKSDAVQLKAKLLAAAIGKPSNIGGYDIANNRQRAMQRLVPPGSVYYLSTKEPLEELKQLHGATIGDSDFMRAQGFGLVFLGTYLGGSYV